MVLRTKNVFQILYEKKNKYYNIKHMGQEVATAHVTDLPVLLGLRLKGTLQKVRGSQP